MPKTKKSSNLNGLNSAQKKAVEFKSGALLVVAGAGTGKTKVITERIRHLLNTRNATKSPIKASEILALTFTEKASQEMLKRVGDIMPLGYEEPYIYTFHSFADRILRAEGLDIGLDTSYKILSDTNQWLLFRQNLFKFDLYYFRPLGNPTKFIAAMLKFISRLQDENISPDELLAFATAHLPASVNIGNDTLNTAELDKETVIERKKWLELADVYKKYQGFKIAKSKLDFGDLILWLLRLFKDRPNILHKYCQQFKHIMIDEFQDTNYAQYELIKMLFPAKTASQRSLLVVGDDSQSIYKFRGAAVSNILQFMDDYPAAEMLKLTQNYRSNQEILDTSYKVIQNNNPYTLESKLGISKKLTAEADLPTIRPEIYQTENMEDEVEFVIAKILQILAKEPNYTYKDFAILARANSHLDPFILALKKYGLPYQLVGNRGLYDQEEVRNVLALLKFVVDQTDTISLYRSLNIHAFDNPHEEITRLLSTARFKRQPLWEVLKDFAKSNQTLADFYTLITSFQEKIIKATPSEFVYEIINTTNYLNEFTHDETVENELKLKNLDLFFSKVKGFEIEYRQDNKENPTIIDFVEYITLMIEAGENPAQAEIEDIDTINLLTVHAGKGLEFPVVFMINLVSDRFPTRDRKDQIMVPNALIKENVPQEDAHIQEERRLFYVGMTRAQKYLFMTLAKNYGGKREKNPSGFVQETGLKIQQIDRDEIKKANNQTGLFGVESAFREPVIEKNKGFDPSFVSYTQLSSYETCPLQYKYSYVLKIPVQPNHALTFGDSIHKALKEFHTRLARDEKPTIEELLQIFDNNWDPSGYISEEHKLKRYEFGKQVLTDYYNKNAPLQIKTKFLEQAFNLNIAGTRLYGKIDRVDELPEGGVEIIDYKTGQMRTQKEVDKDEQLSIYALGVKEALQMEPKKLSLYFVETGEKITTNRDENDLNTEKAKVKDLVGKIKSGDFAATPGMHCTFCDYKSICPYAWKG